MVEYRRGIPTERKNESWHWHPDCLAYPVKSFAIRDTKPLAEDLCAKCAALAGAG